MDRAVTVLPTETFNDVLRGDLCAYLQNFNETSCFADLKLFVATTDMWRDVATMQVQSLPILLEDAPESGILYRFMLDDPSGRAA
jgi:hypothetical protein